MENKENAAKDEQSVNKAAANVAQQADQPNCQQNSDECIKHKSGPPVSQVFASRFMGLDWMALAIVPSFQASSNDPIASTANHPVVRGVS